MIQTTVILKVIPEKREELLQTLQSMTKEILKEKGCISCTFYQEVENKDVFNLIEEWETQEEMESHLKSEMFSAIIGVKSLLVEEPDIKIKVISYSVGMESVDKARGKGRSSGKKEDG